MEIRGNRRCTDCGAEWSYFETGSIECPECASKWSVRTDDRPALHTDTPTALSFGEAVSLANPTRDDEFWAAIAKECRRYLGKRGFILGGQLQELDDAYLIAAELRWIALHDRFSKQGMVEFEPSETTLEMGGWRASNPYLESLLDRHRPAPDAVPEGLAPARSLGIVDAVEEYLREFKRWVRTNPDRQGPDPEMLAPIRGHRKRIRALSGMVDPVESERLVEAARRLGAWSQSDLNTPMPDLRSIVSEMRIGEFDHDE